MAQIKKLGQKLGLGEGNSADEGAGAIYDGNIATKAFLELLLHLRIVFLQDSVILRTSYPKHELWTLDSFSLDIIITTILQLRLKPVPFLLPPTSASQIQYCFPLADIRADRAAESNAGALPPCCKS